MGEFLRTVAGFFVAGVAGGVLGGFVVYLLAGRTVDRSEVEPAGVFDGIEEETAEVPVIAPALADRFREFSLDDAWPMAGEETVPIKLAILTAPPRIGHRPDDVAPIEDEHRLPPYMLRPDLYPTVEFPQLAQSPPRWPTGEYEVLDGAR